MYKPQVYLFVTDQVKEESASEARCNKTDLALLYEPLVCRLFSRGMSCHNSLKSVPYTLSWNVIYTTPTGYSFPSLLA